MYVTVMLRFMLLTQQLLLPVTREISNEFFIFQDCTVSTRSNQISVSWETRFHFTRPAVIY